MPLSTVVDYEYLFPPDRPPSPVPAIVHEEEVTVNANSENDGAEPDSQSEQKPPVLVPAAAIKEESSVKEEKTEPQVSNFRIHSGRVISFFFFSSRCGAVFYFIVLLLNIFWIFHPIVTFLVSQMCLCLGVSCDFFLYSSSASYWLFGRKQL
ncbi:unnamed protein product [Gongylonema pulchrum]|uniref:Uncharacterized protein n=1 Tax=Gongylonema pulchrum TaxID=637853 RepID=A0A3P6TWM1_9BILA|nr:unnamed protein product [Gongylonema pulchrum]